MRSIECLGKLLIISSNFAWKTFTVPQHYVVWEKKNCQTFTFRNIIIINEWLNQYTNCRFDERAF